jgi:hypothetical protein
MFRRLKGAIFREPKVILPKLCVCYVVSAEYVKVGSGYRLVLSVSRRFLATVTSRNPEVVLTVLLYRLSHPLATLYGVIPKGAGKTLHFIPAYLSTVRNTRSAPGITAFLVTIMMYFGETCL